MKTYELFPKSNQKSFYVKAKVIIDNDGKEKLYSYDTLIIERDQDGILYRRYNSWSATTGKHIMSFCGLNKSQFFKLPML